MKTLWFVLAITVSLGLSAQKVKLKDNTYFIGDEPFMYSTFKFRRNEVANFTSPDERIVYFTASTQIFQRNNGNGTEVVRYAELKFNNGKSTLYSRHSTMQIVKEIYLCSCLKPDGTINVERLLLNFKTFKQSSAEF